MTDTVTVSRELLRQAIDTIGYYASVCNEDDQDTPAKQAQAALRAALEQPAPREHMTDGSQCWCNPETVYTDPDTGASVIIHKEPQ